MKTRTYLRRLSFLSLAALAPFFMGAASGKPGVNTNDGTAEVMRMKFSHSQDVLRGLALRDFVLIKTNASRMVRLSHAGGWMVRQTPEYELFTTEFRRSAEALVRAADDGNIDAATVAYAQMTFSCVSCHKYMRAGRVQKTSGPVPF